MKSPIVGAAGFACCCMVVTLAAADAAPLRLTETQLDGITAGERLLDPPSNGATYRLSNSLLQPPAPPPPVVVPPSSPNPPVPIPNTVTVSQGGVTLVIGIPTAPEGSTTQIGGNISGNSANAFTTVMSEGGSVLAPGVSASGSSSGN